MSLTMRNLWRRLRLNTGECSSERGTVYLDVGNGVSQVQPRRRAGSVTPSHDSNHAVVQTIWGRFASKCLPSAVCRLLPARMAHGFSLIEVLVAMTILSIIVLIVAGIFQQTGLAWSLGLKRADAQSVTRAVVGALGRDLAMMVDPHNFVQMDGDTPLTKDDFGSSGKLSGGLDFWILRPPTDPDELLKGTGGGTLRELIHVTYSGGSSVTRKEEPYDGGKNTSTSYALKGGSITFERVNASGSYDSAFNSFYDLPAVQIKIKPQTPPTVNDYEIAVASCGPDGKWGTEDDIRPWPEGEDK